MRPDRSLPLNADSGRPTPPTWQERLYRCLWYIACPLFFLLFHLRVLGRGNVPDSGGVLVIANHQSYLDPPIIGAAVRRPMIYLAKKSLFHNRWFARLISTLGAIPIDTDASGVEGIKQALAQLRAGRQVLVFPEGSRTPDGLLHEFKPGIVVLIRRARTPVLPVAIAGAFELWPMHQRLPRLAPPIFAAATGGLAVVIGKPIAAEMLLAMPPEEMLAYLQQTVAGLRARAERLRGGTIGLS